MASVRFIVKLGGAALTEKANFETVNSRVLDSTVQQLKAAYDLNQKAEFIVVHGAGSFGHFQASLGRVDKGGIENVAVRDGFVGSRVSVRKLNGIVVATLAKAGIPAVGVSPCGFWRSYDRQVAHGPVEGIERLLEAGLIPVLHGDCVLDDARGCTVLSGDVIVKHLSAHFKPEYVVFLTNVEGLYDKDPAESGAQLIRHITVESDGHWTAEGVDAAVAFSAVAHDTTGGIRGKVQECAAIACSGYDVYLCRAGTASSLQTLLRGGGAVSLEWRGTRVSTASSTGVPQSIP